MFLECGDWPRIHIASIPFVDGTARIKTGPRTPVAHHAITGRDLRHVRTNLKNNGPCFMTKQMRKELVRTFDTINLTDLRTTNARGVNVDEDLSAFERGDFNLVDDQRLALLDKNGGLGFQEKVLATAEAKRRRPEATGAD